MCCGNNKRVWPQPVIERVVQPLLNVTMKEFLEQNGWAFIGQSCACQNALLMYRHPVLTPEKNLFININKDNNNMRVLTASEKYVKASFGVLNWQEGYNKLFA